MPWEVNFVITALVFGADKHVQYVMELYSQWTGLTWKQKHSRLPKHTASLKTWRWTEIQTKETASECPFVFVSLGLRDRP